jgi:Protein-L-isoaspartate(D-aspartate) O-methyltransferase (PCMT)
LQAGFDAESASNNNHDEVNMKFAPVFFTLWLIPVTIAAQDAAKRDQHQMHRLHHDPKAYIGALEDPKRDAYQKPHEVLTALGLKPGEIIADIGAGSGYFTFHLAHHVGDKGKVYAVDVSPDMILHINRRIRELKVNNVVSILPTPTIHCFRRRPSTGSSSATPGTISIIQPSISRS